MNNSLLPLIVCSRQRGKIFGRVLDSTVQGVKGRWKSCFAAKMNNNLMGESYAMPLL